MLPVPSVVGTWVENSLGVSSFLLSLVEDREGPGFRELDGEDGLWTPRGRESSTKYIRGTCPFTCGPVGVFLHRA